MHNRFVALLLFGLLHAQEPHWDWSAIKLDQVSFPQNFVWGVATAEYQISGATHCGVSNWSTAEKENKVPASGVACNSWNLIDADIACMKELGVKAYRFSVEWSVIEPEQGQFSSDALSHYEHVCMRLRQAGIQPMVTLHHFTHPTWFEDMGGFFYEHNIFYFVRFCMHVFERLRPYVSLWCTINEPGVYAFQSYVRGVWPPFISNFQQSGQVLANLLKAHTQTYQVLKNMPGGFQASIGIVHSITHFEPYHEHNPVESVAAYYLNHIYHQAIFDFLKTGVFTYSVPVLARVDYANPMGMRTYDFIGLNYYSHVLLCMEASIRVLIPTCRANEVMTDMPYPSYAEGLYRAIAQAATLGVPIYITENGIADATDDRRALFIKQYVYALSAAIKDGFDVRGYFYWSLLDNYEWDMGYAQKFGLYEVDFTTGKRTLRSGALAYVDAIKQATKPRT